MNGKENEGFFSRLDPEEAIFNFLTIPFNFSLPSRQELILSKISKKELAKKNSHIWIFVFWLDFSLEESLSHCILLSDVFSLNSFFSFLNGEIDMLPEHRDRSLCRGVSRKMFTVAHTYPYPKAISHYRDIVQQIAKGEKKHNSVFNFYLNSLGIFNSIPFEELFFFFLSTSSLIYLIVIKNAHFENIMNKDMRKNLSFSLRRVHNKPLIKKYILYTHLFLSFFYYGHIGFRYLSHIAHTYNILINSNQEGNN